MSKERARAQRNRPFIVLVSSLVLFSMACQVLSSFPTPVAEAPIPTETATSLASPTMTATATAASTLPAPPTLPPATDTPPPLPTATATTAPPSATPVASTSQPAATNTTAPTATATAVGQATFTATPPAATATATAVGAATATQAPTVTSTSAPAVPTDTPVPPTFTPEPAFGENILPNGSFEGGDYLQSGIPELQIPEGWFLEWDEGPTGFGSESWDVWVRPEVRVLPSAFLPPHERPLFIYDGDKTVKIFKGYGAISVRLLREVTLDPGTYQFEISFFPDLVVDWVDGEKVFAGDPTSGEVRLITGPVGTGWIFPRFGQKNTVNYVFTLEEAQTIRIGAGIRGRFAIANNGWFVDAWTLRRIQ